LSKRSNIEDYLIDPDLEPGDLNSFSEADRKLLRDDRIIHGHLERSMNTLASTMPAPLYSDEEFAKMLGNRLVAEGKPGRAADPTSEGFFSVLKSLFAPGIPLYAGGLAAATATVVLVVLVMDPFSSQQQVARQESSPTVNDGEATTEESAESDSDGPTMMATGPDRSTEAEAMKRQPNPSSGTNRQREAVATNAADEQRSAGEPGPVDPARDNEQSRDQVATNLPDPETTPPIEGSEELSEEIRRGILNERYAAAFSEENRLKREVRNAESPEEKRAALNKLLNYYEGKGESQKATETRKQIAELD
jgi:hypothetical protein